MANFLDEFENDGQLNATNSLLRGILRGGQCVGYEDIDVDETAVVTLTKPASASYALIALQADITSGNADRVIHFREDGINPTTGAAGVGMPLGDNGSYSIKTTQNINNFKAIGIEAGKAHKIRVQYYA